MHIFGLCTSNVSSILPILQQSLHEERWFWRLLCPKKRDCSSWPQLRTCSLTVSRVWSSVYLTCKQLEGLLWRPKKEITTSEWLFLTKTQDRGQNINTSLLESDIEKIQRATRSNNTRVNLKTLLIINNKKILYWSITPSSLLSDCTEE